MRKESTSIDTQLKALEVSTVDDVLDELDSVQKTWVEKDRILGGKVQLQFHKVCNALAEHDRIFDMIPNQNKSAALMPNITRGRLTTSAMQQHYAAA